MGTNGGSNNTLAPNVFNLEINCSNLAINLNVFAFFYVYFSTTKSSLNIALSDISLVSFGHIEPKFSNF